MPADVRFIDFVHARRPLVGGVLLALAVGCVILAGWCGLKAVGGKSAKPAEPKEVKLDDLGKSGDRTGEFEPLPYFTGLACGVVAALGLGAVGAFFLARPPSPEAGERRRQDRVLLLVGGYVAGLSGRAAGLVLFVVWFGKLAKWMAGEPDSQKDAWMPILAVLVYLIGAGVTFLGALPARAEERNSPWIRRAVYAVNFGLTTVVLIVGLVLANIAVGLSVRESVDTAGGEFAALSDPTVKYVQGLKQTVKVYAVTGDGSPQGRRTQTAALRVLAALRDANPGKVQVEQLSAVTDRAKIQELRQKYQERAGKIDLQSFGVLVATDKPDPVFVSYAAMVQPADPRTGEKGGAFVGEAKVVNAFRHLTEARAVAYFTQGSGEPRIARPADPSDALGGRGGERLASELAKIQCAAKPLEFKPFDPDPTVPDDADLVVVVDPLDRLPDQTITALRKYLGRKRVVADEKTGQREVKPGRLLAYLPARNAPDGQKLVASGLEPLLEDFGLAITDRGVYAEPTANRGPDQLLVTMMDGPRETDSTLTVRGARVIAQANERGAGPAGQCQVLFQSGVSGENRITWLETKAYSPPERAFLALDAALRKGDDQYVGERIVRRGRKWPVAALAVRAEPDPAGGPPAGVPVAAVFGFAHGLTDDTAAADGERSLRLFSVYAAAVRGVPPSADSAKPKGFLEYEPNPKANALGVVAVPVGGTLIAALLLGVGMWVVRRK